MKQPLVKSVPKAEFVEKEMVVHIRCNKDWKAKLQFLSEYDSNKSGKFVSVSAVIRSAIQKMFKDRQNTLYPPKKSAP